MSSSGQHGSPGHHCAWSCPGADPLEDIRAIRRLGSRVIPDPGIPRIWRVWRDTPSRVSKPGIALLYARYKALELAGSVLYPLTHAVTWHCGNALTAYRQAVQDDERGWSLRPPARWRWPVL